MKKAGQIIQKTIIYALILLMAVLILATVELGYYIFKYVKESDYAIINLEHLMELFGVFMLVLIGIELLRHHQGFYLKENVMHVEVVVLVAIIAVARKVVVLKIENIDGMKIIGIAFVIVALACILLTKKEPALWHVCLTTTRKTQSQKKNKMVKPQDAQAQ